MKILKIILAVFICAALTMSIVLNFVMLNKANALDKSVKELKTQNVYYPDDDEPVEDVNMEDDVTIGEMYVIRSTLNISDAYKSGDTSALSDRDKETLDMAKAVLDSIITDGMSDYEKELAVYKWMTTSLQFDEGSLLVIPNSDADCDNPYGVLKYHNAVCVGYATTFRLFMQMMDIECMVVHDIYLSHSWDLVKIEGEWYHTDIYSDQNGGGYTNFNMNDDLCSEGHEWNRDFFPAATGLKYNYAYSNMTKLSDYLALPSAVRELCDKAEATFAAYSFDKPITDDDTANVSYMMETLNYTVNSTMDGEMGISYSWLDDDGEYILFVSVYCYDTGDDIPDIDGDVMNDINSAIEDAFGAVYFEDWYDDDVWYDGIIEE